MVLNSWLCAGARVWQRAYKPARNQKCRKKFPTKEAIESQPPPQWTLVGRSKQGRNIPIFLFLLFDPQGLSLADPQIGARGSRIQAFSSWGPGQDREEQKMDLGWNYCLFLQGHFWVYEFRYIFILLSFYLPLSHAEHTHSNNRCNHCWDRQQLAIDFERPASSQCSWICKTLFPKCTDWKKTCKKQIQLQTTLSE